MLTGSKKDTVINIAFTCKLLTDHMSVILISGSELQLVRCTLAVLSHVFIHGTEASVSPHTHTIVVADSDSSFRFTAELFAVFLACALRCDVFVCCCVSPTQKADVVGTVSTTHTCILTIRTGGNNEPRLYHAHVSFEISGYKER